MLDALRTIMEGILNLVMHGSVLILVVAVMLAFILLTAWFDGRDFADQRSRTSRPRPCTRRKRASESTGDRGLN